jgi:hypothetical protein
MIFKPDFFDENKAFYYFSIAKEDGDYEFYANSLFENSVNYFLSKLSFSIIKNTTLNIKKKIKKDVNIF